MKNIIVLFSFVIALFSCDNLDYNNLYKKGDDPVLISKNMQDLIYQNMDTTIYYINDMNDLMATLDTSLMPCRLGFKNGPEVIDLRNLKMRLSVQELSITGSTVDFEDMDGLHYIKLKLSQQVASKINYQYENPTHPITAATYICCWQYQDKTVRLNKNQRFGSKESLLCGLIPSTKDQLLDCIRGYTSFTNFKNENEEQITLRTCCLRIVALDNNGITDFIDMRYPCPWTSNSAGYIYNYRVLTL